MHCAYATVFLETIRKDFVVLMLHHILTISLLLFSFGARWVTVRGGRKGGREKEGKEGVGKGYTCRRE